MYDKPWSFYCFQHGQLSQWGNLPRSHLLYTINIMNTNAHNTEGGSNLLHGILRSRPNLIFAEKELVSSIEGVVRDGIPT